MCDSLFVLTPQAVWIAYNTTNESIFEPGPWFQYRKRYGLHAMQKRWLGQQNKVSFNTASGMDCMQFQPFVKRHSCACFNTASGMDCMQYCGRDSSVPATGVSIPQAVWIACNWKFITELFRNTSVSIPQAVWIACNAAGIRGQRRPGRVSIPQAVWIACNAALP